LRESWPERKRTGNKPCAATRFASTQCRGLLLKKEHLIA
jgi:hypothetical protein